MRFFLLSIVIFTACKVKVDRHVVELIPAKEIILKTSINYDSCKKNILAFKEKNKSIWPKCTKPEREKFFTEAIVDTIIPAWVGTKWSFNGTTEIPGEGSIACGYFVTTVLRDAGLPIARVKLAQAASEEMIKRLVQSKYIHRFRNLTMQEFINFVESDGYGLYIIGLDNHTGFIFNSGKDIKFMHSTFVATRDVQIENAITSTVLNSSKYKIIGKISADENAVQRWINY